MAWSSQVLRRKPLLKNLIIFYGYPSSINAVWNVDKAASIYAAYDIVVFGFGYQEPTHEEHANTLNVIAKTKLLKPGIEIFGYVPVGVGSGSEHNLTMDQIKTSVDQWQDTGVTGIFWDEFGYDYRVTRERQNECILYARGFGLNSFINAFRPDYAFKKDNMYLDWIDFNANPNNIEPVIGRQDYFCVENAFFSYNENTGLTQGNTKYRLLENMEYKTVPRSEYGNKTYAERFGTQYIALDMLKDKDQDYFNLGYFGSVILGYSGYGASIRGWGASINSYNHYPIPQISYHAGDRLGLPVASAYIAANNTKYENALGQLKLTLIWDPDPNDDRNLTKGTRQLLINGEVIEQKSGLTARRPKAVAVGHMYFDTTLGKPIWWDGTNWIDGTKTTV